LEHSEVSQERAINNQQLDGKCADNELDKANMLKDYISTRFNVSLPPPSGPYMSAEHVDLQVGGNAGKSVGYRGGCYESLAIYRCF